MCRGCEPLGILPRYPRCESSHSLINTVWWAYGFCGELAERTLGRTPAFTAIGKWGRNHVPDCTYQHLHPGPPCCSTSSSTTASLLASSTRRAGRCYRSCCRQDRRTRTRCWRSSHLSPSCRLFGSSLRVDLRALTLHLHAVRSAALPG